MRGVYSSMPGQLEATTQASKYRHRPRQYPRALLPPAAMSPDQSPNHTDANHRQFTPGNFAIDEYRPIRVAVIGAGISGIVAGVRYVSVSMIGSSDWLISRGKVSAESAERGTDNIREGRRRRRNVVQEPLPVRISCIDSAITLANLRPLNSGLACDIPAHCVRFQVH